jgi:putative endonuclease
VSVLAGGGHVRAKDALGRRGEDIAAQFLEAQGLEVIERNWRCDLGEIDIVAADGDCLVVCEVKTRSSLAFGSPAEAVTPAKAARLRRLATRWLADHPTRARSIRIDVVGVVCPAFVAPEITHLIGVV